MLLFADDLKLVVNPNLPNVTQHDLDLLDDWQKKWLMSFNTSDNKCKALEIVKIYMYLTHTHLILPCSPCFTIVESEKDLAINIVSDLNWNNHIT